MRCLSSTLLALCLSAMTVASCTGDRNRALAGESPNIIFILADDLGWSDLSVYGNRFNEAPNLSRMAEEGVRFTSAYAACPVCSPTRASIMSGQYPARVGITDFIIGHWRPYEEVIVPKNRTQYLPLEIHTLGEILKDAGYSTGYFGKWHLGDDQYGPDRQGFDRSNVYRGGGYFDYASRMTTPLEVEPGTVLSRALTDLGIDFIESQQDKPFFLFLAHYDVHVQLDADSALIMKYMKKDTVDGYPCNPVYAAMIEQVDNSVGRILDKVNELGIADHTLVVFFSDNGGLVSRFDRVPLIHQSKQQLFEGDTLLYVASSNAPLRGEKGTLYEGGIREPLIMWWPGHLDPGRTTGALVSSVDFFPTFAELAGVPLPQDQVFDGESLVELMEGGTGDPGRTLYWHYPVYHHDEPASALRMGDWKLIQHLVDDRVSLYNLERDPGESLDFSATNPEKVRELMQLLDTWRTGCNAEFPAPNPGFDPDRRYEWGIHPDMK
jgi:arylsulfatase A